MRLEYERIDLQCSFRYGLARGYIEVVFVGLNKLGVRVSAQVMWLRIGNFEVFYSGPFCLIYFFFICMAITHIEGGM